MSLHTPDELRSKKCLPCEGGVAPYTPQEAAAQLMKLPQWQLVDDGQRIRREWRTKDFMAALEFFRRCGEVAESDGHHPDLHLTRYRQVAVELWTHAIGGLSENDFILAAKIDALPIELKS